MGAQVLWGEDGRAASDALARAAAAAESGGAKQRKEGRRARAWRRGGQKRAAL